jgi:hypothetical protein
MADDLDLVARLFAWEGGRALCTAERRAVSVQPHALVLCTLAMAGDDTTVHGVALGALGRAPIVRTIADPHRWNDQRELLLWLSDQLDRYFSRCAQDGTFPQLWLASDAAFNHLDLLADLYRARRDPALRALGERLAYLTERAPIAGQQSLHVATERLRAQWTTGQSPDRDHHLASLLAWIDRAPDRDLRDELARVESLPMGIKPDTELDRALLYPCLEQHRDARARDDEALASDTASSIHEALADVLLPIYTAAQRAAALVQSLEVLPVVETLEGLERDAFAWWLSGREQGYAMPLRDTPKRAALELVAREELLSNHEAALVAQLESERTRGALNGRVLVGDVRSVSEQKQGRKVVYTVLLASTQPLLRFRRGDRVHLLDDTRLAAAVERIERTNNETHVILRITDGMRSVGVPSVGTRLELGPAAEWGALGRIRKQFGMRLAVTPWTHDRDARPEATPRSDRPSDPLAALEALR